MESITASSSSSGFEPANVRFDGNKCWKPSNQNDPSDYLEVDLGRVRILTGLATHGFNSEYVNLYKLQYSTDNVKWNNYLDLSGSTKVNWLLIPLPSLPFLSLPNNFLIGECQFNNYFFLILGAYT